MEFVFPCSAFESRVLSLLQLPEPTQWENELASGKSCELAEHMDVWHLTMNLKIWNWIESEKSVNEYR